MHSTCSQNRIDVEKRTNNQHNAHTQPYSAHTLTRARAYTQTKNTTNSSCLVISVKNVGRLN